jgi:hypothetical protein
VLDGFRELFCANNVRVEDRVSAKRGGTDVRDSYVDKSEITAAAPLGKAPVQAPRFGHRLSVSRIWRRRVHGKVIG